MRKERTANYWKPRFPKSDRERSRGDRGGWGLKNYLYSHKTPMKSPNLQWNHLKIQQIDSFNTSFWIQKQFKREREREERREIEI